MHIQWYPGHMTKAMRMMQESIRIVDCVIYVLDCRAVESCLNPEFDRMIANKPVLYVLNKADLVEPSDATKWTNYFASIDKACIAVSSLDGKQRTRILEKLRFINRQKLQAYAQKGVNKSIRCMVVGVPNTGKSTLINSLCGSKRTITGNRPGVTRGKQWVSLEQGVELLDTPGSLPPAFADQLRARNLAFIGSIKEDILPLDELALELVEYLRNHHPSAFLQRYKLQEFTGDNIAVLNDVAKARGFLNGKNGYDFDRAARAVIDDFRKQRMGKIMLDYPPSQEN